MSWEKQVRQETLCVIIPSFNRAELIGYAINSILDQTDPPEQVIVVDDGSTDREYSAFRQYRGNIQYIWQENKGKAAALNNALHHTWCDLIYVLDDDDIALPNTIELFRKALSNNPEVGFAYGARYLGKRESQGGWDLSILHLPELKEKSLFIALLEQNFLVHPAICVRRECYLAVGGFDERFIRSQDYEMLLRLSSRYEACRIEEPVFIERQHEGSRGSSFFNVTMENRNRVWFYFDQCAIVKHCKRMELYEFLPARNTREPIVYKKRLALLQKGTIYGRKGLWRICARAIVRAGKEHYESDLDYYERDLCARMFGVRWATDKLLINKVHRRHFGEMCIKIENSRLRFWLARGVFYQALTRLERREWRGCVFAVGLCFRLLGLAGVCGIMPYLAGKYLAFWK